MGLRYFFSPYCATGSAVQCIGQIGIPYYQDVGTGYTRTIRYNVQIAILGRYSLLPLPLPLTLPLYLSVICTYLSFAFASAFRHRSYVDRNRFDHVQLRRVISYRYRCRCWHRRHRRHRRQLAQQNRKKHDYSRSRRLLSCSSNWQNANTTVALVAKQYDKRMYSSYGT